MAIDRIDTKASMLIHLSKPIKLGSFSSIFESRRIQNLFHYSNVKDRISFFSRLSF